jgi:hypothetical protein
MVAVSDFSGLASSVCALASAPAIKPMVSLHRCMGDLPIMEIKADGAGFRALGADAVPDGFLGVLRHQLLQLCFGRVVVEIGRAGPAEHPGKFRPGIG